MDETTTTAPTVLESGVSGVGYGVGRSFLGPVLAGALDSPDMRSATWSLGLRVGVSVALGVALVALFRGR